MWDQSEGSALERIVDEDQHNDSTTMSTMFAMMKTYGGLERCLGRLTGSLLIVQDEKRQLQRECNTQKFYLFQIDELNLNEIIL